MKHAPITKKDLVSNEEFDAIRNKRRHEVMTLKKNRRFSVGPDITFYFENKETLIWQIQEMLFIEKGGDEQIQDELDAYNPLIPNGDEWVATMMIEIDDFQRRRLTLAQLGHIENQIFLSFDDEDVQAIPTDDMERTNESGKASAVHFLHFRFSKEQKKKIQNASSVALSIRHPRYYFTSEMTGEILTSLKNDLSKD